MASESTNNTAHPTESFPSNNPNTMMMMMMMGHHHHRPILSSPNGSSDDDGGGPNQNDSGANKVDQPSPPPPRTRTRSNIHVGVSKNIISESESECKSGGSSSSAAVAAGAAVTAFDSRLSYKSPGGGGGGGMAAAAAAALRYPFTAAQRKELERQAIIYKYMMAAIPVPPHLLFPADPTTAAVGNNNNGSVLYNLRCGIGNRDVEAGRCKRTDGKKWRCSRDVAPHQKYCERHMHRGRPRSRKPVEHPSPPNHSKKSPRLQSSPTPTTNHSSPPFLGTTTLPKDAPNILDASDIFSSPAYKEPPNRMLGWSMDGDTAAADRVEQQWLHLMDTKRGVPVQGSVYATHDPSILQASYEEQTLNLFSYADFGAANIHNSNDQCQLFLKSDLVSSNHPPANQHCASRDFIDAWSNGDLKTIEESSVPSSEDNNLSPSSLTLSMAMVAGNALDEGMRLEADFDHHEPKDGPDSWLPFNSGGPLAEVLQPSSLGTSASNPASPSPYTTTRKNGDSANSPATASLSPTGILHKALMFPHSDSSVCNSPTLAASAAAPEFVAFQWLS